MTEQLFLVALAIAIAVNAVLIVALLLVVRTAPFPRRSVEGEVAGAATGTRTDRDGPRHSDIALDVRPRVEPGRALARRESPVSTVRRPSPAVAGPDPEPYAYQFGTVALDEAMEDDRPQPETELELDLEPHAGAAAAADAEPEVTSIAAAIADVVRPGQPRRFQVVMPHDPHASRTIETFISSPRAATSQRGALDDTPRLSSLHTDDRTGLLDVAAWNALLADEEARLDRYRRSVSVLFGELDGLERLEERFGEAPADRILRAVAATFTAEARASDRVARIGPGRFGVLLTETDERGAGRYAARVGALANAWLESAGVSIRLATGWASPRTSGGLTLAIRTAEARLRAAEMERRGQTTEGRQG